MEKLNRDKIREYQRKWRKLNKDKIREYKRKNKEQIREDNKRYQREYAKRNPLKRHAQNLTKRIPMKDSCEICGSKENLQRHHWRYDKPLLFNTLCNTCHVIQHLKFI